MIRWGYSGARAAFDLVQTRRWPAARLHKIGEATQITVLNSADALGDGGKCGYCWFGEPELGVVTLPPNGPRGG